MRDHPLYFALCVLFAIAIEFIILRRMRARIHSKDEPGEETSSRSK